MSEHRPRPSTPPEQRTEGAAPWVSGARWDGSGTRFRLVSRHAEAVELCLFSPSGEEIRRELERVGTGRWESYRDDIGPGQAYGYRVHGPWRPSEGHRFNPHKLLVDPGALLVSGEPELDESLYPFAPGDPMRRDERDSAAFVPRSVVADPSFEWGEDRPPRHPWNETVIYECHLAGTTRLHPRVPEPLRGTYLGLSSPAVVEHLRRLGVTAVEILPLQQIASEPELLRRGLTNYFGYSPLGFLAPHAGYASRPGAQLRELQRMVRELHAAGIEVLVDLVLNHTAEGGPLGPMLSLKGIDNVTYYRLDPDDPSRYVDFTGCGNTLDVRCDEVLDLLVATLMHWVEVFHIDGFRFDLAPVLARDELFDPRAPFFERLRSHPSLGEVKLIAEPWDLGPGGYCLGRFPAGWREWNDRFRDAARSFWRGDAGVGPAFATAMQGSPGIFTAASRGSSESVDYVTCHDGFTLADLVSYEEKRNHANGEGNRDGAEHDLSSSWGIDGPTNDPEVLTLRRRAQRNLMATVAFASGVPMLSHGDEIGRSQRGNNNAYCHDSELTWIDWEPDEEERELLAFSRLVFALGRRWRALEGPPRLLSADGEPIDRLDEKALCFGLERAGARARLLLLVNGSGRARLPRLPAADPPWRLELATFESRPRRVRTATLRLPAHSLVVLTSAADGRAASPPDSEVTASSGSDRTGRGAPSTAHS